MNGDPSILHAKALLDGVFTLALTSTMGPGVIFSAVSVLVYQGTLTLFAARLAPLLSARTIACSDSEE